MRLDLIPFVLLLQFTTTFAKKVVPLDFKRRKSTNGLRGGRYPSVIKRAFEVSLGNAQYLYYANITVGTPGQLVQLQIDSGSADVWMSASDAEYCEGRKAYYDCPGGVFDPDKSSSYNELSEPNFDITYIDGSFSKGNFFTDKFVMGDIKLNELQMGLATTTSIGTGIIGLAFAADESVCANSYSGGCDQYPSILQQMVSNGFINSQAYSLWLNDEYALYGSILFGGVDTSKYVGKLTTLPIQPDSYSHAYTSFTVVLSGFAIKNTDGSITNKQSLDVPAILDSGTSITLLPDDLAMDLINQVDAQYNSQYEIYLASCKLGDANAFYEFQFGGSSGPVISLPVGQMFEPIYDTSGRPLILDNGDEGCQFGLQPAKGRPILLGDTFQRAAYIVFDLDNREISIAQTNFNATGSNILEIQAGPDGVPDVAGTASAQSAEQTASVRGGGLGSPGQGGGGLGGGTASVSPGGGGGGDFSFAPNAPFGNPTNGGGGGASESTGAASHLRPPPVQSLGLTVAAIVLSAVAVLVGMGSFVVLM